MREQPGILSLDDPGAAHRQGHGEPHNQTGDFDAEPRRIGLTVDETGKLDV